MDQSLLMSEYSKTREQFNPKLFERKNETVFNHILKVLKSVEREGQFTFKLHSYRLVTNYAEIQSILCDYENLHKKGKNKRKLNIYEYINLKETDMHILISNFYMKIRDEEKILTIYIGIPIYINKYYFRISGNLYLPNLQIVDGSTFNSSTSKNAISDSVILKTILMSLKTYRNSYPIKTTDDIDIYITNFSMTSFSKTFPVFKYILAKFGLYRTMSFMNFDFVKISKSDPKYNDYYTFKSNKIYISVPKVLFDNDTVLQAFIYTLYVVFKNKLTKYDNIFTRTFWLESLGGEFGSYTKNKGLNLLESIEGVYDLDTKEALHLPEEYKQSVYHILRWIITEFSNLMERDNLDLGCKRIRLEEYMASLYAMKFASIIHRFADLGHNLDFEIAEKYLRGLKPTYLLDTMIQCKFINCKNTVNDIDTFQAIKYTMNQLPGMDEKPSKNSKLPVVYKHVHYSQLGRLDLDSSPKSAPGVAGTLTPYCELEDDGAFTNYKEPITWDNQFSQLMADYKQSIGMKENFMMREKILGQNVKKEIQELECSIKSYESIMKPVLELEASKDYSPIIIPLDKSGLIYYSR